MNTNPTKTEINFVRNSLVQFNRDYIGNCEDTPLHIVEYDDAGAVIGGILGVSYWDWMYIEILWIDEKHRKEGLGSKLLAEAEKEAVRRECHHVLLDTFSWQAPDFYKKHGYEVIAVLPDHPNGNQKYLLQKAL